MHLRGISVETERLAKMEAARRGMSLSEFVSEAILRATRAPQDEAQRRLAPLASERAWYEAHRDDIAQNYAGQFVAIVGSDVLVAADTLFDVARKVRARIGERPAYVVDLGAVQRKRVAPSPSRQGR